MLEANQNQSDLKQKAEENCFNEVDVNGVGRPQRVLQPKAVNLK